MLLRAVCLHARTHAAGGGRGIPTTDGPAAAKTVGRRVAARPPRQLECQLVQPDDAHLAPAGESQPSRSSLGGARSVQCAVCDFVHGLPAAQLREKERVHSECTTVPADALVAAMGGQPHLFTFPVLIRPCVPAVRPCHCSWLWWFCWRRAPQTPPPPPLPSPARCHRCWARQEPAPQTAPPPSVSKALSTRPQNLPLMITPAPSASRCQMHTPAPTCTYYLHTAWPKSGVQARCPGGLPSPRLRRPCPPDLPARLCAPCAHPLWWHRHPLPTLAPPAVGRRP